MIVTSTVSVTVVTPAEATAKALAAAMANEARILIDLVGEDLVVIENYRKVGIIGVSISNECGELNSKEWTTEVKLVFEDTGSSCLSMKKEDAKPWAT